VRLERESSFDFGGTEKTNVLERVAGIFFFSLVSLLHCRSFSLRTTVCIRIVADCGTRIFQVTTKFYAGYNVHVYYYFGYYFYTLLVAVISS
jgi:hypothetical protein